MKKALKFLLIFLGIGLTVQASGFKRLGQKLSSIKQCLCSKGFKRNANVGMLLAQQCLQTDKPQKQETLCEKVETLETNFNVIQMALYGIKTEMVDCIASGSRQEFVKAHLINPTLMQEKNCKVYALFKKIQKDCGLQNVDIEFYHADEILGSPSIASEALAAYIAPSDYDSPIESIKFMMIFWGENFKKHSNVVLEHVIRHELAHAEQVLSQCEGIGRSAGMHQGGIVYAKDMNVSLMEQSADATACGYFSCWRCLRQIAIKRISFLSARMNKDGYCCSPSGYLSFKEIMQYAKARKLDGQLCPEHAQVRNYW